MITFHWKDVRFRRAAMLMLVLIAFALTVHEVFGDRGYLALRRRKRSRWRPYSNYPMLGKYKLSLLHILWGQMKFENN